MPSMWCPKCQTNKHRNDTCPKCGFIEEDTTKTHSVPRGKEARVVQGKMKKNSINFEFDKNKIIIISMLSIITVSLAYIAYDKFRERSEMEKAFQYYTGTDNVDEYLNATSKERIKKINESKMIKDTELMLGGAMKKTDEKIKNMFKNKGV